MLGNKLSCELSCPCDRSCFLWGPSKSLVTKVVTTGKEIKKKKKKNSKTSGCQTFWSAEVGNYKSKVTKLCDSESKATHILAYENKISSEDIFNSHLFESRVQNKIEKLDITSIIFQSKRTCLRKPQEFFVHVIHHLSEHLYVPQMFQSWWMKHFDTIFAFS